MEQIHRHLEKNFVIFVSLWFKLCRHILYSLAVEYCLQNKFLGVLYES
jgi:hypothetical protein